MRPAGGALELELHGAQRRLRCRRSLLPFGLPLLLELFELFL
ncbi:hypothetical protein QU481_16615 [Crenobacter sp. SG2303]|uniref:Uncharacterized protein n=1 Tax=Crenobacter oryzisoli TaxID=3056844 RepID=A0ABT7XRT3_9NEIS|nr:hypothetical protein [Crenobacter sp. SG2303]MDN0076492.1 hypothetical protein [Crenobacter sp. SG2303]